ncbi:YggS family pyridoxal phosphate-dependent enzyme [Deltaproteobacteria bacterium OttesenSCG-928-M10]|nr:YggS family pyridoxal phosphate-dependent enzyme [Deltaproteobacteria bacterium OttesenSCG-928-M10]
MTPSADHSLSADEASGRLREVRSRMDAAAVRAGRKPGDITLLAVSKTFPAEMVRTFLAAGQLDFGENYIQEARAKAAEFEGRDRPPNWHFIGHLQTNKSKYAAALFHTIHSLDNLELAAELDRRAKALSRQIAVYIQVNVSGEGSKSGMEPAGLPAFLDGLAVFSALKPQGLMTMPPWDPDPETARPYFAALRELKERQAPHLPGLSMGMSGDLEVAIEEGATIVRVGTALFGSRY